MKKRKWRKTILLILGILIAVLCILLFVMPSNYEVKVRPKSAEDLLNADYYDFTDSAAYYDPDGFHDFTFIVSDQKMLASDYYALTEEQRQQFAAAVPQPVYVSWDEDTEIATVGSEAEGQAQYYMLDSGQNGVLLFPAHKTVSLFEPLRPLAYYLRPDRGEKTQQLLEFIDTYSSEEDIRRVVDAVSERDFREDQREETALRYYHLWMRVLFQTKREYPVIREVSAVSAPDITIRDTQIDTTAQKAVKVKLENSNRDTYVIYLQSGLSGLAWNIVLLNDKVIRAVYVKR